MSTNHKKEILFEAMKMYISKFKPLLSVVPSNQAFNISHICNSKCNFFEYKNVFI